MTTQQIEPMPLEELRERLRYGAQSQVSTLEPIDLARMRLTVEALVEEVTRLRLALPLPTIEVKPFPSPPFTVTCEAKPFTRCGATDGWPGMRPQRCIFPRGHACPCLFGDS